MRSLTRFILFIAVTTGACSNADRTDDAATAGKVTVTAIKMPGPYLRGALLRNGAPSFVPCGTTDTLQVMDPARAIAQIPVRREAEAIFAVIAGDMIADSAVRVDRIVYASGDRGECYNVWDNFDYRATGSSPGWVAEISGSTVHLRRQGDVNDRWSGAQKDSANGRLRFTAPAEDGGDAFELVLEAAPCTNATTGAWSMWTARAVAGGDVLRGCAVPGR